MCCGLVHRVPGAWPQAHRNGAPATLGSGGTWSWPLGPKGAELWPPGGQSTRQQSGVPVPCLPPEPVYLALCAVLPPALPPSPPSFLVHAVPSPELSAAFLPAPSHSWSDLQACSKRLHVHWQHWPYAGLLATTVRLLAPGQGCTFAAQLHASHSCPLSQGGSRGPTCSAIRLPPKPL